MCTLHWYRGQNQTPRKPAFRGVAVVAAGNFLFAKATLLPPHVRIEAAIVELDMVTYKEMAGAQTLLKESRSCRQVRL